MMKPLSSLTMVGLNMEMEVKLFLINRPGVIDEETEIVMVEDSDEARSPGDYFETANTDGNTPEDPTTEQRVKMS
ncbi:hypothetical protein LXL04_022808 [Taraxacum kok-saghyz]